MTTYGKLQVAAAVAALSLVTLLVLRVSSAAFSATTTNTNNSWSGGSIALGDDDGGGVNSAMFNVSGMVPSQTVTKCIVVTYTGSVDPTAVKLYSAGVTDNGLAQYLNVTVQEGDGGTYANCTGFNATATIVNAEALTTFSTNRTGYGSGSGSWDPSATGQAKTYKFSVTLASNTPGSAQGASAQADFKWELQTP